MKLESPVFAPGSDLPSKYTCKGENINPPLRIAGVPETAQSLALIMHDPDAPAGDYVHWMFWNLNPQTTVIPEHATLEARLGKTSFQEIGYGGPCPPSGTHRYIFDLYALDVALELPAGASRDELLRAIEGHILQSAQLIGICSAR